MAQLLCIAWVGEWRSLDVVCFELVTPLSSPRSIILASAIPRGPPRGALSVPCLTPAPRTLWTLSGDTEEQTAPWARCWMKVGPPIPGWHQMYLCHSQKFIFPSQNVTLNADPSCLPLKSLWASALCWLGLVSVPWSRAP